MIFIVWIVLILLEQKSSHKKVCQNKYFCIVVIPSKETKIFRVDQYEKPDKTPYIVYVDLESLIKKVDGCKTKLQKSSTTKVGEHIPCGYSMCTIWTFDGIENKQDLYTSECFLQKNCESLGKHAMKIINFEKKKIIPLTNEEYESYLNQTNRYVFKKRSLKINTLMKKIIVKFKTIFIKQVNIELLHKAYVT